MHYIQQIGVEGLNPADYDPDGLATAIRSGDYYLMSAAATQRFNRSRRGPRARPCEEARPGRLVDRRQRPRCRRSRTRFCARRSRTHDIAGALNGLAADPSAICRAQGRARSNAGERHCRSATGSGSTWTAGAGCRATSARNISSSTCPSFHATLVEDGATRWKERAIAGKLSTPTPQLNALATGVILNPWWEVPKSIEKEAAGKKGFVAGEGRGRQDPALAPAAGADQRARAVEVRDAQFQGDLPSRHQCPQPLQRQRASAQPRLRSDAACRRSRDPAARRRRTALGRRTRIQSTLASKKTVQANFVKPVPVYIVYFSQAALVDGKIVDYKDMYGRDPQGDGRAQHEGWRRKPRSAQGQAGPIEPDRGEAQAQARGPSQGSGRDQIGRRVSHRAAPAARRGTLDHSAL